ncbi:FAS-associated factor 1-like [Liolophura sinensis]|uniref:FAS-associated factor 1-like n=1 Tax=Liolophura sinensis TaxID=3198878 RepID=UPI003158F908
MADRDQVLADFQECTGFEDVETSIAILEQHDWSLLPAVQSVMNEVSDCGSAAEMVTIEDIPPHTENMVDLSGACNPAPSKTPMAGTSGPSGSTGVVRMLNFIVEYRDENIPLILADTETVGKIKESLNEILNIPVSKQELRGWVQRKVDDKRVLRDLHLPKETRLYLLTPEVTNPTVVLPSTSSDQSYTIEEKLSHTYTLNITVREPSISIPRQFSLQFPGSKTIKEVKSDVYHLTDVAVRHQAWTGWPEDAKDDSLTLAASGISYPAHSLEVDKVSTSCSDTRKAQSTEDMEITVSDDDETMYNPLLEDDMFDADEEVLSRNKNRSLIPDNVTDEVFALEHLTKEFSNRYGECHPVFYVGSLEDAVKDSLLVSAKERKPLAIYLHHDNSIAANVFCSQVLCSESVVNYLSSNFITWAWDLTHESNRKRLQNAATSLFGSLDAAQLSYKSEHLPVFLIILRTRSSREVFSVIHGHQTLDELMSALINASEVFQLNLKSDIAEEKEREAREMIKREQDAAYEQSLAADRAKARAQQEEVDKQREVEQQRQNDEAIKEAICKSLAEDLPEEPDADCPDPVSHIKIRVPGGDVLQRRFLATNTLNVLLNFVASKGFHTEDFKLLTTYPRKDVSLLDQSKSLKDLNLFPQETLIIEER